MDYLNDTPLSRKNKLLKYNWTRPIPIINAEVIPPYDIGNRLSSASNTIRTKLERGTVSQIK